MTRLEFLLSKMAEECNEVGQIALKTQQFGLDEIYHIQEFTNAERTHHELDDLMAVIQMLNDEFDFGYVPNMDRIAQKKIKVNKYYEYMLSLQKGISDEN